MTSKMHTEDYDSILDSLRNQKEKIDRAIQALEALRDCTPILGYDDEHSKVSLPSEQESYANMQFIDAVKKLLSRRKKALTTAEITEALLSGGFHSESNNPKNVIAAQLHRYSDNEESGIIKAARGLWALNDTSRNRQA